MIGIIGKYTYRKNKSVWEATLNIANTTNGEKILYDIDPIKMVEQAVESATSTTKDIVSNPDGNRLLYWDKKMSQKLFDIPGLQLSDNIYNLDSNISIRIIGGNVNTKISTMDSEGRELSNGQMEYTYESLVAKQDMKLTKINKVREYKPTKRYAKGFKCIYERYRPC